MNLNEHQVAWEGAMRDLSEFQCYKKCAMQTCDHDTCFCGGLFSGYDGPDSNAICGDEQLCQYLCDNLDDCVSIDMNLMDTRCFLNSAPMCGATEVLQHGHQDQLAMDQGYALLMKEDDVNIEDVDRYGRKLLAPFDPGFSWNGMLRFKPIQFSSGGQFKLCFCDSELSGGRCHSVSDYSIEVGAVHASGVSCLVSKPKLQRVACTDQFHGGLRCYGHFDAAPRPVPPLLGQSVLPSDEKVVDLTITTFCLNMPEEEARNDARCQAVSGFQSTR